VDSKSELKKGILHLSVDTFEKTNSSAFIRVYPRPVVLQKV